MSEVVIPTNEKTMAIGFGNRGFELRTFDDAYRFAKALHISGMSPLKSIEANVIAMQLGAEIGLPPMAAVQSIYVVNSRPNIMAAQALAIVEASGTLASIKETLDGQGDARKATCRVVRKGRENEPYETSFTMGQAKAAGLIDKERSIWKLYPDRMLKARALGWALNDRFKDKLMGLSIVETVDDMKDITPQAEPMHTTDKPKNMDEFIAKVATATPAPISVEAKPEPKAAAANLQVWVKLSKDIKAAINKAKTSEEVNTLISAIHKVTIADMQKAQPDFYNEIMDFAMDKQSTLHQAVLSQTA